MQRSASTGAGLGARVDRGIDAVFAIAGDARPFDRRSTLRSFEKILLLHLAARLWQGAFAATSLAPAVQTALAAAMTLCLAMLFVRRLAPLAIGGAFCVMLTAAWGTFPMTSNHAYLELWALLLLIVVGGYEEDEASALAAALRLSVVIMVFYTGLQKVLYGAYFSGQFLILEMILKPDFGAATSWLLSADEWQRLRGLIPNDVGVGPYKTDSPLLLAATNIVYVFELSAPALLLWKRTRVLGMGLVFLFVIAIEAGAREMFFAALLANLVLLFWPSDAHRRALPAFVAGYAVLALLRVFDIGGVM